MTAATFITLIRIILVPFLMVILLTELQNRETIAFILFLIAALSDAFDGFVARKFNQVTELGKFLDPLADKLLVSATLLALVSIGLVQTWIAAIIILREIFIAGFRFYFLMKDTTFSSSWPAKYKTALQIFSIALIMISSKLPYPGFFLKAGTISLYCAAALTVYSGIEYVLKYARFFDGR